MGQAGAPRICGNCGTVNSANDQFCSNCGYALDNVPTNYPTIPNSNNPPVVTASGRRKTGALTVGQLLSGRYRIVAPIGQGGFGAVYKAADERFQSKRIVAIKEMSDAQLSTQQRVKAIQDFRNEAELLVELSHPNLPNVSDFFEEGNKAYLVMEFIQGKTLEGLQTDAGGPLDEQTVMDWALQLCSVLHYLHTRSHPIIFRDMKPSNVMLTADSQIKLIDFGIARIFKAAVTKDTTLLGSQGYAPLEQYGRGQSDARSDIYALGATLYDLLTNELPADAPTRRIHPQTFVPPRQLNPRISPEAERIILNAMADDPADRFQTAQEMFQAIVNSGLATPHTAGIDTHAISTKQSQKQAIVTPGASTSQATPQLKPGQQGPIQPSNTKAVSRRNFLIGGATVVGVSVIGGAYYLSHAGSIGGKKATGTITLNFIYSTEKEAWLAKAIADFNQSNAFVGSKNIQIVATSQGSVDTKNRLLAGTLDPMPTIWSPASFLELNQLNTAWAKKHGQELTYASGDYLPKGLVFSPLVFAIWKERAQLLKNKYGTIDWKSIHEAVLLNSWADLGGSSSWGPVKLGQTRPDQSNSGLLSITLLAYSYYNSQRNLTVAQIQDKNFLKYFTDVESAVQQFGRSSGTYFTNEVITRGPAAYDIIPIYENLVLTNEKNAQARWETIQPTYPSINIVSDHPFAILNGSWVNDEEKEAAKVFRDFLLSDQQQKNALLSGFRPLNPNIKITNNIDGNPFINQQSNVVIPPEINNEAQAPGGDVVEELLQQWLNSYKNAQTALSISTKKIEGQA